MELSDEITIPAPRETVYAKLNDAGVLRECIPGCEELERRSETELDAVVTLKIGPMKARFKGSVTLDPTGAPGNFSLAGEGNGGVAGFAKGGATVELVDQGEATLLRYQAHAEPGGKIAQLGNRLIESTAKKLSAAFFGNFEEHMAGDGGAG